MAAAVAGLRASYHRLLDRIELKLPPRFRPFYNHPAGNGASSAGGRAAPRGEGRGGHLGRRSGPRRRRGAGGPAGGCRGCQSAGQRGGPAGGGGRRGRGGRAVAAARGRLPKSGLLLVKGRPLFFGRTEGDRRDASCCCCRLPGCTSGAERRRCPTAPPLERGGRLGCLPPPPGAVMTSRGARRLQLPLLSRGRAGKMGGSAARVPEGYSGLSQGALCFICFLVNPALVPRAARALEESAAVAEGLLWGRKGSRFPEMGYHHLT